MAKKFPLGYTTIEQSTKLINEGLSPDTADFYYEKDGYGNYSEYPKCRDGNDIKDVDLPCWTLTRLLWLIPNECSLVRMGDSKDFSRNYYLLHSSNPPHSNNFMTPIEAVMYTLINLLKSL